MSPPRLPRLALSSLLAGLLAGLTLPAGSALAAVVVYVSEGKDNRIAVYSFDEADGAMSRAGEIDLGGSPGPLALSPDGRHLYAAVRSTREFATLAIDPGTGLLSLVARAPASGSAPYIFPDPSGRWLLAAYYGEGLASVSRIAGGAVAGEPVSVVETGSKAHCIRTDPSNRFAFVPHAGELNKVEQLRFDPETGQLTPNQPPSLSGGEGQGPRHLKFHPNGRWVYLVNEQGKSVTLCDYDPAQGTLSIRQTLSTHPPDWDPEKGSCAEIQLSADGRFAYASNRGHDSIAVFSLSPETGELASLGQTPTEKTPRSFHLIPGEERYLVAAGQDADKLAVYRRDPETGALAPLATYETGGGPAWVLGAKLDSRP